MRRIYLSKFERVAGLFIVGAVVGSIVCAVSVAVKQGWFEPRVSYHTTFENADGVHAGSAVKIAGLSAGAVDDVELLPDSRVEVFFHIMGKFQPRVKKDSTAQLIRPFIIGDRILDISVGTDAGAPLAENTALPANETMDLMTIISGKKMGDVVGQMTKVMDSMQVVMSAFSDKERIEGMIRTFDRMEPLLVNLSSMSTEVVKLAKQATHDDNLKRTLANTATLTQELNVMIPAMNRQNPEMGRDLAKLTHSLGQMTDDMQKAMAEMGPDGKNSAKRAVEALNEATILIKALQKSFFLSSSVREVRAEEKEARMPANDAKPNP